MSNENFLFIENSYYNYLNFTIRAADINYDSYFKCNYNFNDTEIVNIVYPVRIELV